MRRGLPHVQVFAPVSYHKKVYVCLICITHIEVQSGHPVLSLPSAHMVDGLDALTKKTGLVDP